MPESTGVKDINGMRKIPYNPQQAYKKEMQMCPLFATNISGIDV